VAGQLSVTITPSGGAATNVISAFAAGATAQQVATQLAAEIAANVGLTATAHRHQAMFIVLVNRGNEVAFANIASTTPSVLFQEPALNFTDAINLLEGSVLGLNFNDSDPTTIDMIAVENIPVLGVLGATGGDFLAANLPGWHNVAIVGERAVDPTNLSPFVAGHEVGHAIFDGGNGIHNTTNPQNLFQPAVSPADTIGATKRLDDAQNTRARLLSGPATVPALLDRR
jgi:hypothetical protein